MTIQWAFEDWALAEMAAKMGKRKDYIYFHKRSTGWTESFNKQVNLILPRRKDGSWLHTDPLNGAGYVEANAWQATFGFLMIYLNWRSLWVVAIVYAIC